MSLKKERLYLREEETTFLTSILHEWNDKGDKKARDLFVNNTVLSQIQNLNLKDCGPELISVDKVAKVKWEARISAVNNWFRNHRPFKDKQVFKLERKIPLRRIFGKLRAAEIDHIITSEYPDVRKGDKTYPGIYQHTVTKLMDHMSEEELAEMEAKRKEWQEQGPPVDARINAGKKYARKAIVDAHKLLDKDMYTSCITIAMRPDPLTGSMGVSCHDYIADLHARTHGKQFKSFSEWAGPKYVGFMELLIEYASYIRDQRNEEPKHEDPPTAPVVFEAGPGGLPLLPPPVHGVRSAEIAKQAKEVIRAYFLRHYKLATGCELARTPWATIGEDPVKFFDPACLPEGFRFQDPSRMGVNVKTLLTHLRQRQEVYGVGAFRFHHVLCNNELEPAKYPASATPATIPNSTDESQEVVSPKKKGKGKQSKSSLSTNSNVYDPALMAGDLPASSDQMAQAQTAAAGVTSMAHSAFQHGWPPIPLSNYQSTTGPLIPPQLNPSFMQTNPSYPLMYHQMPHWGQFGMPAWPPANVTAGQPAFPSAGPNTPLPDTAAATPAHLPPALSAFQFAGSSSGFQDPAAIISPGLPFSGPSYAQPPPFPSIDSHPIPPGEPPFAQFYHRAQVDPRIPPVVPAVSTPSKKGASRTPKKTPSKNAAKTPGKRKREDEEDSPTKQPTRVSTRNRTPKKPFEID